MSTVGSTKSNGLFNSGKGNLTLTSKTPNFLTVRIVRYWDTLPGETVKTVIIKAFKEQAGQTLICNNKALVIYVGQRMNNMLDCKPL